MIEQEITINGLIVNFKIIGEGKPLLILHGWGSKSDKWQETANHLAENGIKSIIPDLPGFGKSQRPDFPWGLQDYCNFVEKFVELVGLNKFFLLGHSFGGAVVVKYAREFPQKPIKIFLVSSACLRPKRRTIKKILLLKISKTLNFFSFLPFYNLARRAFYKFIVRKSDYLYLTGVMKESYLKVIREDLRDVLSQIKVPATIIWGEADNITPLKYGRVIHREIKNSKMVIIPGQGHDLEQKIPIILAEKILENFS